MRRREIFFRRATRGLIGFLALLLLTWGCSTVPYTGRPQVLMVSQEKEVALGYQAFRKIQRNFRPARNPALQARVRQVGERIARVAERPDYQWEFVVFEDDRTANAFCLPGGKVGIFTGLFKYIQSDEDLAVIISHEVAHALARHAGERLSQGTLAQLGGAALGLGLAALGASPTAGRVALHGYELGTKLGILLPYSRLQEAEADRIGLILMAKAGYNPEAAIHFWERFAEGKKDKARLPQFLSTHPSDPERLRNMRTWLPEARQYYRPDRATAGPGGEWSGHQSRPR